MLVEIDEYFYCGAMNSKVQTKCPHYKDCDSINFLCRNYMHKWPTPDQFREEYGNEWTGAVYYNHAVMLDEKGKHYSGWECGTIDHAIKQFDVLIVCACTPFGKPANDWRPS